MAQPRSLPVLVRALWSCGPTVAKAAPFGQAFSRLQATKVIPAPVLLGKKVVRWRLHEVLEWVDAGCPSQDHWHYAGALGNTGGHWTQVQSGTMNNAGTAVGTNAKSLTITNSTLQGVP